jgi:hypothetical protein
MRVKANEPFGLKLAQRLSQRDAAYPMGRGERILAQLLALGDLAR